MPSPVRSRTLDALRITGIYAGLALSLPALFSVDFAAPDRTPIQALLPLLCASSLLAFARIKHRAWILTQAFVFCAALGTAFTLTGEPFERSVLAGSIIVSWLICLLARWLIPRRSTLEWERHSTAQTAALALRLAELHRRETQEEARVVHDTVLRGLTALSFQGLGSSRQDLLAFLDPQAAWTEPLDREPRNLRGLLEATAARHHADGFTVSVHGPECSLSPAQAAAVSLAVDEALLNVRKHTESPGAEIAIHTTPSHIAITVSDTGSGFVPGNVSPDRLGLRSSILGRMRSAGGNARVTSRPGSGTTVTLELTRP
ncbi:MULTISPECIES: ATP-binding protein [Arthrobacter]|uniref:ATP-binding protein n=2 Tax=Arthrobacter TaxID=1663 RepID=A0ABU9KNF1_9MICC|nr:ATP-binding protein [Arthrobacter sp. YJM1]MDP5227702.1 hypothetical protein [Arthrobacter sp. YJM1]